jgi:plasmid stabilization system protein ParE
MTKLVVHEAVHDEFQEAYLWYAKQSRSAAERFRLHVRDAFDRVTANPRAGTAYDEGHRYYRVKNYPHLVIYRYSAADDTATIVAIFHPSQDQSYWQNR